MCVCSSVPLTVRHGQPDGLILLLCVSFIRWTEQGIVIREMKEIFFSSLRVYISSLRVYGPMPLLLYNLAMTCVQSSTFKCFYFLHSFAHFSLFVSLISLISLVCCPHIVGPSTLLPPSCSLTSPSSSTGERACRCLRTPVTR